MELITVKVCLPQSGFRWLFQDDQGSWWIEEPPTDWPLADYTAADPEVEKKEWELADKFWLVANTPEHLEPWRMSPPKIVNEPNLYLSFASERATPATILGHANRFGLLGSIGSTGNILSPEKVADVVQRLDWRCDELDGYLVWQVERASDWLMTFAEMRHLVRKWAELADEPISESNNLLENTFDSWNPANLAFSVSVDPVNGCIESEIRAATLKDMIKVQWGTSIASGVEHRQCQECPAWFTIHPVSGRPDKRFCSDACRMRAYRKRKQRRAVR